MALTPTIFEAVIDGTTYQDPIEWSDMSITWGWDDVGTSGKIFLSETAASYTFVGDAYTYIISQYDSSYCGTINAIVKVGIADKSVVLITGEIFLSELTIDRRRCTVQAKISGEGYSAWIKEKRKQKLDLAAVYDYDGGSVAAVTSTAVQFHIVSTGVHGGGGRDGYSVFDAFTYLVDALSEEQMLFASSLFDVGGDQEGAFLFNGEELRSPGSLVGPVVSFEELLDDMDSLFNVGAWVEETGGVFTLRVEKYEDFFFSDTIGLEIAVKDVGESVDEERLYGRLEVGSDDITDPGASASFPSGDPSIRSIGWEEEEYGVRGDCVIDNVLDLKVTSLIIDSNSMEAAGAGADDKDADTFLVDVNTGTAQTVATDFTGSGDFYYNFEYINGRAIENRPFDLPAPIYNFFGDLNDLFEAELSADVSGTTSLNQNPVAYNTENSDPNANYDNAVNFNYNAPSLGAYVFQVETTVDLTGGDGSLEIRWMVDRGAGYTVENTDTTIIPAGSSTSVISRVYALSAGDDVRVQVDIAQSGGSPSFTTVDLKAGSKFAATASTGGGDFKTYDPDDTRVIIYEVDEVPITPAEYATFLADKTKLVQVDVGDAIYIGHIREITYEPFGLSSLILWARRNQVT